MPLQIDYARVTPNGQRAPLGGVLLQVTTSATPAGSQPTTPNPSDSLLITLRSDAWAAVDIAATPDPAGTATSRVIVGPGAPQSIIGRKGLKVAVIGTAAPGGASGADLTAVRATATDARDIAAQARADVAAKVNAADLGTAARANIADLAQPGNAVGDALAGRASISHTAAPDANYQAIATDVQIGFAALTSGRTVTLPDVDTYPLGQVLFIADESGQCSPDRPITIAVGASTGDSIAGAASIQITDPYNGLGLRRGAANLWIIAR